MTSDNGKRRGARRLIADAVAEHEVQRIGALSPEELAQEMKKEGRDPAREKAVAEKAIAAADAPALGPEGAAPKGLRKPGGARRLIEDAIAEDEVERIGGLSPEELAEEMKKEGRDPARAKAVAEKALAAVGTRAEPPGKVVSLEHARASRSSRRAAALTEVRATRCFRCFTCSTTLLHWG